MRKTDNAVWLLHTSPAALTRSLRLAVCIVGIGLCLASGAARAGDDEEEDNTPIEDKIMRNIMSGLGGTNMSNKGIDYRERSPLVVPRSTDLPPPETGNTGKNLPNWPKDPTIAARKAAAAANKDRKLEDYELAKPLTPAELAPKPTRSTRVATPQQPGSTPDAFGGTGSGPMLSPSQLGFSGSLGSLFKGNAPEATKFKGEPTRETLTQPPSGYMTPSPNYAYGTGPAQPIDKQGSDGFAPNMDPKRN